MREAKKQLEAELETERRVSKAKDKVLSIEKDKNKKLREINDNTMKLSDTEFGEFANKVMSEIFKGRKEE